MKITVVCDVLGEANNGTTLAALNLISYLRSAGHEVCVVSPDGSVEADKVYTVPALKLVKPLADILKKNGVKPAKADEQILEEAIKDADVVHIQVPLLLGLAAAKVATRLGKPLTASFHCQAENITAHLGLMNFTPANHRIYKFFYKHLYRYCDKVHYPSQRRSLRRASTSLYFSLSVMISDFILFSLINTTHIGDILIFLDG